MSRVIIGSQFDGLRGVLEAFLAFRLEQTVPLGQSDSRTKGRWAKNLIAKPTALGDAWMHHDKDSASPPFHL